MREKDTAYIVSFRTQHWDKFNYTESDEAAFLFQL